LPVDTPVATGGIRLSGEQRNRLILSGILD